MVSNHKPGCRGQEQVLWVVEVERDGRWCAGSSHLTPEDAERGAKFLRDKYSMKVRVEQYAPSLGAEQATADARDMLAGKLIDTWVADKGKQIPWAKAVQIVAIVTEQSDSERDRLLKMGDEDGSCGMCGRSDAIRSGQSAEGTDRSHP